MTEEKKADEIAEEKKSDTANEEVKEEKKDVDSSESRDEKSETNEAPEDDACAGGVCGSGCCLGDNKKSMFMWFAIIVVVIGGIAFYQMKNKSGDGEAVSKPLPAKKSQEVKDKVQGMIVGKLVPEGTKIEIGDVSEESGLYKMAIKVDEQEVTAYITKDMSKFIPQLIDVKELENPEAAKDAEGQEEAGATEVQAKSAKPVVEVFVMSHCPYGTQIEKGILPVLKELGTAVDAKFKFVDYAMHGEKEVVEQLRQYCIQEKEPQKFYAYLDCFLKSEDATTCMRTAAINQSILTQCVTQADKDYKVTELLKNKETWVSGQFPQFNIFKADNEKYGVQGSPTLVINGEMIQAGRDSASLLKAVCSGFTEQPEACKKELSSAAPAPGFGEGVDKSGGASADAGCGA